jgi:molybdopterin-containing oxidoreductase family membrane subunit
LRSEPGVLGVFSRPDAAARAVEELRAAGVSDVRAAMPAPFPELVAALGRPQSALGWATLGGGLAGTIAGFALTVGTSLDWPLVTGGKPIVSIPTFVIVAFEVTVLVGALANLAALIISVARRRRPVPFDPRWSGDRIAVFAVGAERDKARAVLERAGAEEVIGVDDGGAG